MIGEKVLHFEGKGTDLAKLGSQIVDHLESEHFSVQSSKDSEQGVVIQAKKGGFLDKVIDADRALTIAISGSPDDFNVHLGIGKWLAHLGIAMIETLVISDVFLVVDVAESAWNIEIEDKLAKVITALVG